MLKFPISLTGNRQGGHPEMLDSLIEWYENANDVGKHASITVTNITTNSSIVAGPNDLDAWSRSLASTNLGPTIDTGEDFTIAFVNYKYSYGNYKNMIHGFFSAQYRAGAAFKLDSIGPEGDLNTTTGLIRGVWQSVIVVRSGGRVYLYVDGINLGNKAMSDDGVTTPFLSQGDSQATAVMSLYSRAFSQDDVDIFHNGGEFLTYADL